MSSLLLTAFLFLVAGVVAVPIAARLGLGSVLGYLIAGIVISPVLVALHTDVQSIQHIAEFGVVMMLFLVGLELEPRMLWAMKTRLLGLGGLQVLLTTLAVMGIAMLLGQVWSVALAVGLVLALSSTAIVLQTLNEKGLMKSDGGQASFSVLLFQDIAVIPMLALIPLLALPELTELLAASSGTGTDDGHGGQIDLLSGLPGWQKALITMTAIGLVVVGGSYLTRPIFRFIAHANLREIFTAAALLLVIGIALLMTLVGLSPALGTFIAGVVLANSEYRHELESDIEPFKGLLLGLFFITVGASIDFGLLLDNLGAILTMTLGLILLKAAVLYSLAVVFKVGGGDRWLFALGLAQAGEFGFVLLSFTVGNAVIPEALADQLLLVVTLSMLLTPALFILYDRVLAPKFASTQANEADEIDVSSKIILAGHGRFGGVINRMLRAADFTPVVLDHNSNTLEIIRAFGGKIFFGDATRPDLLAAAGIDEASMLIVAIDDEHQITELVKYVHLNYPHVHIVARAINRHHVYALYAAGAKDIIRDTFDSATRAGRSALEGLGYHPHDAEKHVKSFVEFDKYSLIQVATLYDPDMPIVDNKPYIEKVKEIAAMQDDIMRGKGGQLGMRSERGWMPPRSVDED
ncbi:MAG: monovalent cation:proton antiporter-2 (CPA2) family protein [Gammaproteobacteria bacterium]|nr:monovalent cation:proton antiporter-2 (CPA2) family protein [Gammaproteobacteria bacterium]